MLHQRHQQKGQSSKQKLSKSGADSSRTGELHHHFRAQMTTSISVLVRSWLTAPLIKQVISKEMGGISVSRAAPPALFQKKGEISGRNWVATAKATSTPAHLSPSPTGHGTEPRIPCPSAHQCCPRPGRLQKSQSEVKNWSSWRPTSKIQSNPLVLPQRCPPSISARGWRCRGCWWRLILSISKTRGNQ